MKARKPPDWFQAEERIPDLKKFKEKPVDQGWWEDEIKIHKKRLDMALESSVANAKGPR